MGAGRVHEAVRDLVRARESGADDLRRKRQQQLTFLLRHGRIYEGGGHWTLAHRRWLARQSFEHPAHTVQLLRRLEEQLSAVVATMVHGAGRRGSGVAMRGASFLVAAIFAAEIGDVRRFDTPQLMAFLGMVPDVRT